MRVDARSRRHYRLQSAVFVLLFILLLGVLAWLSQRFNLAIDLSTNQRNSLSLETLRLLENIDQPLEITLFVSPINENRPALERLFGRYRDAQTQIEFRSLNPDLYPDLLREYDIRYDGEAMLDYGGRTEKVSPVTESAVSTAIQRLLRQGERWLVFLEGHGERHPYREANHDYSQFATELASRGFSIEVLNLAQAASIPDNTSVLILASPKLPLLPGEVERLRDYVDDGGNLLWLADPEQVLDGTDLLADQLAIEFLPGIVVDPNSQLMGLNRVDFALVADYPRHDITRELVSLSLFPEAQALAYHGGDEWQQQVFLQTDPRSWSETGELRGEIFRGDNDDEAGGPLDLGISLARSHHAEDNSLFEQRVAILGDADFLSNRYLGNGANLDIGINLLNWLSFDDRLISISPRPAPDTRLELSRYEQIGIAAFFLLLLPLGLLASGLRIWLRRRKR